MRVENLFSPWDAAAREPRPETIPTQLRGGYVSTLVRKVERE